MTGSQAPEPTPTQGQLFPDGRPVRSPLKWAGGKARSARQLAALTPTDGYGRYMEPFAGSAAVFFALRPDDALLADAIPDLIVCLQVIRDDPESLMAVVDEMPKTRNYFDDVRQQNPETLDDVHRAARTLYLNKMAFRGLWRVNRSGQFNAPWGRYQNRRIYDRQKLLAASEVLQSADIWCGDFRETLLKATPGDWIYLDPPYVPDREWGDFTRYTPDQFGPRDQVDLADICDQLDRDGVRWLLTNSDTPLIRKLYGRWRIRVLPTRRDVALRAKDRASADLVVCNYEHAGHPDLIDLDVRDAR